MKNLIVVFTMLCSSMLMAQNSPSISIDGDVVTITDTKGNTWLINDMGISKNGALIVREDEMDEVDAAEDLQDEIDDLREEVNMDDVSENDYEDLLEELTELEEELNNLDNTYAMAIDTAKDSTSIKVGDWKIIIREEGDGSNDVDFSMGKDEYEEIEEEDKDVDNFDTEWFLLSVGYNTYVNAENKLDVPAPYTALEDLHFWGSMDVNVDVFKSRVSFGEKGFVNFNYGLGLEWHHYRFDQDFTILPDLDTLMLVSETIAYDKNKFNTTHATLPLSLGFETRPWDTDESFRMSFGYSPGILIKAKTKHKIDGNSDIEKDRFNLNNFRQEVSATIGYGKFNLYASYDLTAMFKEGEGPELHPVSVGIIVRRGF
ncbi:MAG: hypothetical protein H7Y00_14980 [Fimbriimonadaceae bacterium]|nr:hypothetical protein [Chitinophagales bacterium]